MRRFAVPFVAATFVAIASACSPSANPAAGGSPSPKASGTPGATTSTAPGGSSASVAPAPTPRAAVPVTLKATVDGKPANVEALAYYTTAPGTGGTSVFWSIGKFAKSGEANIGQGGGILAAGEGNFTLHMKMPNTADQYLDMRTLTEAEFKGAANLTYKEGPSPLIWFANGQTMTSGSFTVAGGVVTFKMVADMPGKARENDGTARKIDIEVSGLPVPEVKK